MQKEDARTIIFLVIILLLGNFIYVHKKKETSLLNNTNKYLQSLPSSTTQSSPSPSVDWYQPKGYFGSEEYLDSIFSIISSNDKDFVVFKFPKFPLEIKYPSYLEGSYHDQDLTPSGHTNLVSQFRLKRGDKVIVYIYPGRWGTEGPLYTEKEPLYINGNQLVMNGEKINKTRGYEEKNPVKKTNSYTFTAKYSESGNRIWFVCNAKNSEDETICDQIASSIRFTSN